MTGFERKDGIGKTNKTAFCLMQQCWGLGREYYCPTMFEYEQKDFHTALYPRHKVRSLYWKNRLVIDYWLAPIQRFQTIPWVLSDQFEGGFLEMSMRLHPEVTFRTLRARMLVSPVSSFSMTTTDLDHPGPRSSRGPEAPHTVKSGTRIPSAIEPVTFVSVPVPSAGLSMV